MKVHVERNTGDARVLECRQEEEIASLRRGLEDVDKALFRGNGRPSLVTQTATNTQAISALTRIAWITLTAVIGEAVLLVFKIFAAGPDGPRIEQAINDLADGVQTLNRVVIGREAQKRGSDE